jgi:hypothetical protein
MPSRATSPTKPLMSTTHIDPICTPLPMTAEGLTTTQIGGL